MGFDINTTALMVSQSRWEVFEYVLAGLVAVGCLGEFIHECTDWFEEHAFWKESGGAASALLLVAALALEIPTQFKVNSISGTIEAAISLKTAELSRQNIELSVLIGPRNLNDSECETLKSRLHNIKEILVAFFPLDFESMSYAESFLACLPNVRLLRLRNRVFFGGVAMAATNSMDFEEVAQALTDAKIPDLIPGWVGLAGERELSFGEDPAIVIGGRVPEKPTLTPTGK